MFFMNRKRFEEEVNKRMEKWMEREEREREFRNMYTRFYELEERVRRLEGNDKMYKEAEADGRLSSQH